MNGIIPIRCGILEMMDSGEALRGRQNLLKLLLVIPPTTTVGSNIIKLSLQLLAIYKNTQGGMLTTPVVMTFDHQKEDSYYQLVDSTSQFAKNRGRNSDDVRPNRIL